MLGRCNMISIITFFPISTNHQFKHTSLGLALKVANPRVTIKRKFNLFIQMLSEGAKSKIQIDFFVEIKVFFCVRL